MFENIGGKIKTLAVVLCILGIIASIISGIVVIAGASRGYSHVYGPAVWTGILVIVLGSLLSWIGSFFAYGFGQLIENTDQIKDLLRKKDTPSASRQGIPAATAAPLPNAGNARPAYPPIPKPRSDDWKCPACGQRNESSSFFCKNCGKYR